MKRTLILVFTTAFIATAIAVGVGTIDPPPAQAATTGGYVKTCSGGQIFLKANEKQSFYLHNKIRKEHNLKPFCLNPKLEAAARAHSKDMVQRNYFSHITAAGTPVHPKLKAGMDPFQRISAFGYRYSWAGENIAYGEDSLGEPTNIMDTWMASTGHRTNILSKEFTQIGVGTYFGSTYEVNGNTRNDVTMYTADFGRPS